MNKRLKLIWFSLEIILSLLHKIKKMEEKKQKMSSNENELQGSMREMGEKCWAQIKDKTLSVEAMEASTPLFKECFVQLGNVIQKQCEIDGISHVKTIEVLGHSLDEQIKASSSEHLSPKEKYLVDTIKEISQDKSNKSFRIKRMLIGGVFFVATSVLVMLGVSKYNSKSDSNSSSEAGEKPGEDKNTGSRGTDNENV